ncbi:MAG: ferredoxin family protein [Candidatus Thermoplasmatota archaeon]|nr:ferredoxin family protein [Candidatus Thermoplasmatota archaeon]
MTEKEDEEEEDEDRNTEERYHVETDNKEGDVCVITERCKGCGFCIEFCPVDALDYSDRATEKGYTPPEMTEGCVLCGKCEKICPEFAIYLDEEEDEEEKEGEGESEEERGEWI